MDALTSAIFGGFISKVINDITDVSDIKNKIINAVKNKKTKHQNSESQIYNIIIDVLNEFTCDNGKNNQNSIYEAAEVLFKKEGNKAISLCLQSLGLSGNENEIERFKMLLCETLGKTEYRELYCEIVLLLLAKKNEFDYTLIEKLDEILQNLKRLNKVEVNNNKELKEPIKSRTEEYAKIWNKNMFLNNFTEWDEKKGENIKLSDVYIKDHLPHFLYKSNSKKHDDIDVLLSQYIMKNDDSNKMLLILGQPGIGKSTLITWILNNFKDRIDDILVYQFASDLKDVPWGNFGGGEMLIQELGLSYNDLKGKVLILDGCDEIDARGGSENIINKIYRDLIYEKNIENFTLIITCRENYIDYLEYLRCEYIIIQSWNKRQIQSFCKVYCEKNKSRISENGVRNILKNKNILGIPLLLYMTLALEINIENETSIVSVYDKIFSLNGGIYDRCIDNKNFGDEHRISEIKKQIHQVSREIAFWMFENNSEEAYILQNEYHKICEKVASESKEERLEQDFIIGNFYKIKHCEGIDANELYFIHRSIYEYFVAEYLFNSICEAITISEERLASVFGHFLKKGQLSKTINEFLKYKIAKSILYSKFEIINRTFTLMLYDGMMYYTKKCYKNMLDCEMKMFKNMLEIIHLWNNNELKFKESISKYIRCNIEPNLNLSYAHFKREDLCNSYLKGAKLIKVELYNVNLSMTNLCNSNLMSSTLINTDLTGTILSGANLKGIKLQNVDLSKANLTNINLSEIKEMDNINLCQANLTYVDLRGINLKSINLQDAILNKVIINEEQIKLLQEKCSLRKTIIYIKSEDMKVQYQDYIKMKR